ncbi:hypothetical protein BDV96DRAFT_642482 [Lophiotrema nucula]|uniref:AA1-like domain-containing protein n=1 Tax=Lophiotrema nucula TaxID=690887 RepID=A0A6A5ZLY8_9PLEO|nr:hypothetical protein BDV96DRAFT_642482 [Lophiotrema nucula]
MRLNTVLALIPTMTLASPLGLRQAAPTNVTFTVTDFKAFMADPNIEGVQSNLTFHVTDSREQVDCVIPPTYFWLYAITALYEYCPSQGPERPNGFSFTFQDGSVGVRRGWVEGNKTYTASGSLNPYWAEGVNKTTTPTGTWVTRSEPWTIPVTRLTSA